MAFRISVASTVVDTRARGYLKTLQGLFPKTKLRDIATCSLYTIDASLSAKEQETIAKRLTNSVIETSSIKKVLTPKVFSYAIEIGFLPGVTDNVAKTARQTIEDTVGHSLKNGEDVYTSLFLFLIGSLTKDEVQRMAGELHNSLIQRATIYSASDAKRGFPVVIPKVKLAQVQVRADIVDLEVDDAAFARIGKEGIENADGTRRGPLALPLSTMKVIREYYRTQKRNPTDVELESLAQTWSEHCKHSIFADPLDEVKEGIYKRYIKGATQKIRKAKGKKDFCVSVFKDNSGAIIFDDTYLVTHKVETHNSPSALDPFGGAITGIVGVNRDALGFGLGAKPIANVYGFCVADPKDTTKLYRDKGRTQELLAARRILEGVVRGINAGGNQSGIPTPLGFVATDKSFRGKPLVFAGTVGLIPRVHKGRKLYDKAAKPGDYIVTVGGRVGLDGIHGATFSSESLSSGSPATAVQIGDPITQKKMSDAITRECRDAGLYSSITDNGAGGLSCAAAEMARECGGCEVDLEKVPLKYPGLSPWQIWISESQERMTLAVPKKNWPTLKKIFDRHGVEATRIGTFTSSGRCVVRYGGKKVMDMEMEFLHEGRPVEQQKSKKSDLALKAPSNAQRSQDVGKSLLALLSRPSIGSTAFIARQYDHEVQASSVTKPLQGKGQVSADSGVLKPVADSDKAIVVSDALLPWYSVIDTYEMAAASIDSAIRNAVCAGASRDYLAILDNFCWSSSNTPERLYELKRAAKACYEIAVAYGTPYISGKDSMFNDFRGYTQKGDPIHIAALPTLLVSAIGVMEHFERATTLDLKREGDPVYLTGETHDELGASEYFSMISEKEGNELLAGTVPHVDVRRNAKAYDALTAAIGKGLVASAISVGRGGLAVALARSAIAGQLGIEADLSHIPGSLGRNLRADSILFSESQGRMLVSVRPGSEAEFEKAFKGVASTRIGSVVSTKVSITLPKAAVNTSVAALTTAYRAPFSNW